MFKTPPRITWEKLLGGQQIEIFFLDQQFSGAVVYPKNCKPTPSLHFCWHQLIEMKYKKNIFHLHQYLQSKINVNVLWRKDYPTSPQGANKRALKSCDALQRCVAHHSTSRHPLQMKRPQSVKYVLITSIQLLLKWSSCTKWYATVSFDLSRPLEQKNKPSEYSADCIFLSTIEKIAHARV